MKTKKIIKIDLTFIYVELCSNIINLLFFTLLLIKQNDRFPFRIQGGIFIPIYSNN